MEFFHLLNFQVVGLSQTSWPKEEGEGQKANTFLEMFIYIAKSLAGMDVLMQSVQWPSANQPSDDITRFLKVLFCGYTGLD